MAGSNEPSIIMKYFAEKAINDFQAMLEEAVIIIAVHDDEHQLDKLKKVATKSTDSARKSFVFDNADACYEFVIEKVSSNPQIKIIVFVGGQLVNDVVSSIHACEQVQFILIANKPSFSDDERESMKIYSKVTYMADYSSDKLKHDFNQQENVEVTQQTTCNEFLAFDSISNEVDLSDMESIQRSFKQLDQNLVFRFLLIMSLRTAPPFSSDKTGLIKLLETQYNVTSKNIDRFKETYSSSKAIFFYSKDEFIYGKLNFALRTANIDHLLSFQFIFQDICNQLYEIMTPIADNQTLIVYRGQIANTIETVDLFIAYCKKSFIMATSFLSTSKDKNYALGMLSATNHTPLDQKQSAVLFKIIIRKRDRSFYFPFADISALSNHPEEKEVLFAPGQIFNIDSYDMTWENYTNVHVFEMSLHDNFDKIQMELQSLFKTKNPWYCIGPFLTDNKRYHEAKEFYRRLITEFDDKNDKYYCYQSLFGIAMEQDDQIEMQKIDRIMTELRFGFVPPDIDSPLNNITREESAKLHKMKTHVQKICSAMSFTRPVHESASYTQSDEFRTDVKLLEELLPSCVKILMKTGTYDQVIVILEVTLKHINVLPNMSSDPLQVTRYYIQLGHCYRQLKLNDKAVENYKFVLEQNIQLPFDEQVETLLSLGKTLENLNNHSDALDRYIELAKIYNNNPTVGDTEQRRHLEQTIKQVLLHLIPTNDTCKIS